MKHYLIIATVLLSIATLFSCKKDDANSIPLKLEDSVWCNVIDSETFEQTRIEFTSAGDATLYVVIRGYGANQIQSQTEYTYTYNRPNITLSPKCAEAPALTGFVEYLGDSYNSLNLKSNDGSISLHLTQEVDKDQTIWQ